MNKIISDTYIFNRTGNTLVVFSSDNLLAAADLVQEELNELGENIKVLKRLENQYESRLVKKEEIETVLAGLADDAADLIVVSTGVLYRAGFSQTQVDDVLNIVGKANKAKFDASEDEAKKSVESYEQDDRYTNIGYELKNRRYVIFGDKQTADGPKRKILKSHLWNDPAEDIMKVVRGEYQ